MQILTGKLFKEMVLCGANTLHNNHPEIDALNVFPVPDGDTGTNMSMTLMLEQQKSKIWIVTIFMILLKNYLKVY